MAILGHLCRSRFLCIVIFLMLFDVSSVRSATIYISDDFMEMSSVASLDFGSTRDPVFQSTSYSGAAWQPTPVRQHALASCTGEISSCYSWASTAGQIGPNDGSIYESKSLIFGQATAEIVPTCGSLSEVAVGETRLYARLRVSDTDSHVYWEVDSTPSGITDMRLYDETAGTMVLNYHSYGYTYGGYVDLVQGRTYSFFGRSFASGSEPFSRFALAFDDQFVHVPEPSTAALFGGGLACLLAFGRKTMKRSVTKTR